MNENLDPHNPTPGLFYVLPDEVFSHPDLNSTCKLLYALLAGLAQGNGEKKCYPSNDYLAKRLNRAVQNVDIALRKLDEAGYISRVTKRHPQNGFKRIRYITVYATSKKCLPSPDGGVTQKSVSKKCLPTPDGVDQRIHANVVCSNKAYRNKETTTPKPPSLAPPDPKDDVAVFFHSNKISIQTAKKLKAKHSQDRLEGAIKMLKEKAKKNVIKNPGGWLTRCLEEEWDKKEDQNEEEIKKNHELAQKFEEKAREKLPPTAIIQALREGVLIQSGAKSTLIEYTRRNFREILAKLAQNIKWKARLHQGLPLEAF